MKTTDSAILVIGALLGVIMFSFIVRSHIPQIDAVIVEEIFIDTDSSVYLVKDRRDCAYVYPHKYAEDTTSDGKPFRVLHSDLIEQDRAFSTEDSAKWWLREYLSGN